LGSVWIDNIKCNVRKGYFCRFTKTAMPEKKIQGANAAFSMKAVFKSCFNRRQKLFQTRINLNLSSAMRIGIDAKWYFNGPVSTRVMLRNLLPHLFDLNQEHQWFIFLDEKDRDKDFPFKFANIHSVYLPVPTNMFSNLFIVPRHARRLQLDTVVFQTFPGIPNGFSSISFIHDILFKRFPRYFTWKEKLYFFALPFFTRRASRVVATTDFVKEELLAYQFIQSAASVDLVPLGVNADFKPLGMQDENLSNKIRAKYNLPDDFILFVGRLNARKNIESLVLALPLLHNKSIQLVIAGKEDWKKSGFRNLIETTGIRDRICITGPVSDNEIAVLFAMAKVFCFPSFAEGFGLPPLEAMASGVPVVVSNTTSLPEICGNAAVYIDPYQPESIAQGLNELLENKSFYSRMKNEGLQHAAKFTWVRTADRLMKSIVNSVKNESQ
jgi:glycosyltransferase involved in cell wall biosynthesis